MQARYYWHPTRHTEVSDFFDSVRDRSRANSTLLHLSEALVRSSMLNTRQLSLLGISDDTDFDVQRIRITEKKYPALYRLYTSSPSRLRGYIFGEVLAEAARFRQNRPEEAGALILNLSADFEDVGDDAYPQIGGSEEGSNESAAHGRDTSDQKQGSGDDTGSRVNGLGGLSLLSEIADNF